MYCVMITVHTLSSILKLQVNNSLNLCMVDSQITVIIHLAYIHSLTFLSSTFTALHWKQKIQIKYLLSFLFQ